MDFLIGIIHIIMAFDGGIVVDVASIMGVVRIVEVGTYFDVLIVILGFILIHYYHFILLCFLVLLVFLHFMGLILTLVRSFMAFI